MDSRTALEQLEHFARAAMGLTIDEFLDILNARWRERTARISPYAADMLREMQRTMEDAAETPRQLLFAKSILPSRDRIDYVSWADPRQFSSMFVDDKPKSSSYLPQAGYAVRRIMPRRCGTVARMLQVWQELGGGTIECAGIRQPAELSALYTSLVHSDITQAYPCDIAKGRDIITIYRRASVKSCVSRNPSNVLKFYAVNPDNVHLLYFGDKHKAQGRCLLWRLKNGSWYMDRMYHVSSTVVRLYRMVIRDAIRAHGEFVLCGHRITNMIDDNTPCGRPMKRLSPLPPLSIQGVSALPYFDTFRAARIDREQQTVKLYCRVGRLADRRINLRRYGVVVPIDGD